MRSVWTRGLSARQHFGWPHVNLGSARLSGLKLKWDNDNSATLGVNLFSEGVSNSSLDLVIYSRLSGLFKWAQFFLRLFIFLRLCELHNEPGVGNCGCG